MKSTFSEFSFGFAFTFELSTLWKSHLIGAPILPSLVDEGKTGGYDARLESTQGFVYCAQYKLSERMTRSNAAESRAGFDEMPYFRFKIYGSQRSRQHELLLDLEQDGYYVEYVAPLFIRQQDFDTLFRLCCVHRHALRVRPSAVGVLPDQYDHHIACDRSGGKVTRFSDPVELDQPLNWGEITENGFDLPDSLQEVANDGSDATDTGSLTIGNQLTAFVEKVTRWMDIDAGSFDVAGLDLVDKARAIARLSLGAELFVVSQVAN